MTERTWSERGAWMDAHQAWTGTRYDRHTCQWHDEIPPRTLSRVVTGYETATDAIDAAMDECERLEREEQEAVWARMEPLSRASFPEMYVPQRGFPTRLRGPRPMPEKAPSPASPSPVAALITRWKNGEKDAAGRSYSRQFEDAIAQQAAQWREATDYNSGSTDRFYAGWLRAMSQCADELEGK